MDDRARAAGLSQRLRARIVRLRYFNASGADAAGGIGELRDPKPI
jgi:UDP-glucose 4-epimerase